jgi:2'-5' RNA ligase
VVADGVGWLMTVAFWLMPRQEDAAQLAGTIGSLAGEHAAPSFDPHITLFARDQPAPESEPWLTSLAAAVKGLPACRLRVSSIDHGPSRFKAVFLRIAADPALNRLQARVRDALGGSAAYEFDPHLSLIYKALEPLRRAAIMRRLVATPESIVCDSVAVIVPGAGGWSDVTAWREVGRLPLGPLPD